MKFKTIEEAQIAWDKLATEKKSVEANLVKEQTANNKLKTDFNKLKAENTTVTNELKAEKKEHLKTQEIAKEAIEKINTAPIDTNKVIAKIDGETFEVKFGVDGLTKEELAKDKEKLALLLAGGSGALIKVEGK